MSGTILTRTRLEPLLQHGPRVFVHGVHLDDHGVPFHQQPVRNVVRNHDGLGEGGIGREGREYNREPSLRPVWNFNRNHRGGGEKRRPAVVLGGTPDWVHIFFLQYRKKRNAALSTQGEPQTPPHARTWLPAPRTSDTAPCVRAGPCLSRSALPWLGSCTPGVVHTSPRHPGNSRA